MLLKENVGINEAVIKSFVVPNSEDILNIFINKRAQYYSEFWIAWGIKKYKILVTGDLRLKSISNINKK